MPVPPTGSRRRFQADLHVHSRHSRFPHFRKLRIRSSYSNPLDIYRTARARGMDLITITDHETIDGCLEVLDRLGGAPDFMISEEVESVWPEAGVKVRLTVYDITEDQHREIQRLRGDLHDLMEYLRTRRVLAAFNHFIDTFACAAPRETSLQEVLSRFELFEVRDGARPASYNRVMERLLWEARQGGYPKGFVGGSNAHTLRRIGATFTASAARSREEFLEDLRRGETLPFGADGTVAGMAGDTYGILFRYYGTLLGGPDPDLGPQARGLGLLMAGLTFPLHLVGFPVLAVRMHHARVRSRLREIQRRLDGTDVLAFRERVGRFAPSGRAGGREGRRAQRDPGQYSDRL
ncbi:MAG: hypothetical protein HY509_03395 [Acidobacteria bacterium]|nr:hypothetical protein [Acidobacteriota bacterium]